jgi:hypothetical protein
MSCNSEFSLETLVDFPDDALRAECPITHQHIDAMMVVLKALGIRRVSWADYGDCHGGYFIPAIGSDTRTSGWPNYARTLEVLGSPLRVAVDAAHRHGLELYAYFKPYETGPAFTVPEGSPDARAFGRLAHCGGRLVWLDRFVEDNPQLRLQRRTDDIRSDAATATIRGLKLFKKDDTPTRIDAQNLQIWASELNYGYRRLDVPFEVSDGVEAAPRDVYDISGSMLTKKGDPVRVLTLSGLDLNQPYLLVTTDFRDGPGDFENAATALVAAFAADGLEIPLSVATGGTIWRGNDIDFRTGGLDFDYGFGDVCMPLDASNESGKAGFIAFTRGRNMHLPGALCETEPAVREYWLSWVREMLEAGVDGIDFREENHSTHTDYPGDYGFNPAVIEACAGVTSEKNVARVRGDAYTQFLREAKSLCVARGRRMRINFQLDWYRAPQPRYRALAYPANIDFQWRRWIEEGLCDEAILRFYSQPPECVYEDEIAIEVIERCQKHATPIVVNQYINLHPVEVFQDSCARARNDGRFAGFILYETCDFVDFHAGGSCSITKHLVPA